MSSKSVPPRQAPVDPSLYRRTCARFATGITVVTVVEEEANVLFVTVMIEMINAIRVEKTGATLDPVDDVAFAE